MSQRPTAASVVCFAALLLASPSPAQPPAAEQAVRQLEDRRIKAMIDDDFATLEAILADDLTYTHSSSVTDTKAAYIDALRTGKTKYESFDRTPSTVRAYGDTAVITGGATVGLRGQTAKLLIRYTLVYVKRGGEWKMVAWQSTRVPQ